MELKEQLSHVLQMNPSQFQTYFNEFGDTLLPNMVQEIGNPDQALRDQLIYPIFRELLRNSYLSDEQFLLLFEYIVNHHLLYYGIGEQHTDSVFTRSYSALLLADILTVDAEKNVLPDNVLHAFFETCSSFLSQEQDTRSFVNEKGWAHSIAYGADLYCAIIRHPAFNQTNAPTMLQAVKSCLWKNTVYIDDEEERFANIVQALITKGIEEQLLIEWVEQLFGTLESHALIKGYDETFYKGRTCTLHFMKTVYFALKMRNLCPTLQGIIFVQVANWSKFG